jgi:aminoglycoside phosphotransferase (APT) family kinase protein
METLEVELLAYLRGALARPELEYVESPVSISGGYDTRIYGFRLARAPAEWSGRLILRLFRVETPGWIARFEATVHNCVAELGMCAPRVVRMVEEPEPLGGAFLIMERVAGRNLLSALASLDALRVPGWLADTQARLHALDGRALERALRGAGFDPKARSGAGELAESTQRIESHGLEGLCAGAAWLARRSPEPAVLCAICHGDFHPLNVLCEGGRVTGVIDWTRAHLDWPEYDVATTLALLGQGPIRVPGWLTGPARAARALLARSYLAGYRRRRPLDPVRLRWFEALRLLRFLVEEGAEQAAELAGGSRSSKPSPWADPAVRRGIYERFESLTDVRVRTPSDG